jgi:2-iminobutanoate/2-iminopropanoate deaminase
MGKRVLRDVPTMPGPTAGHPYWLVRTAGAGVGYVSGVLPYDREGRVVQDRDGALRAVLRVLEERVEAAGGGLDDVVKVTVFLTDIGWRDALDAAWLQAFPGPRPARTTVEVRRLPKDAPLELDAVIAVAGAT